ncbi:MAG TPA: alpha-amylase family glycosyl hydrolase [Terriglobales bacterium]|nr:alpha-amylase family glycosyl hydrolase [Terriglobales bacterium]
MDPMRVPLFFRIRLLAFPLMLCIAGCGGGGSTLTPPPPSFTLSASPNSLLVAQTTNSVPVTVSATANNEFSGSISVALGGLPAGVMTLPTFPFPLAAGGNLQVTFIAGPSVPRGNYALTFFGTSGTLSNSTSLTLTVSGAPLSGATGNFKQQVIYQIVTDRFFDGDTTNDDPAMSQGLFDPMHANFQAYWGGDFAGIQQKMAYLAGMGVTAIWISPPVDNIDVAAMYNGSPYAPYHGYWAHDMMCLEEHFGNATNPCDWTAFDNMVAAAHQNGIRVIVDFAANDTNPDNAGEFGLLLSMGQPFASFQNDALPPGNFFHHNPDISDFNDPYQLQYYTLEDLADLNQDNASIDQYLKGALLRFMNHGVDAFRLDAVKDVTWGWEYSLANVAFTAGPTFLYGEWDQGGTSDPLYPDSHKFANHSGISLLDFPLANAFRDVFGNSNGGDFHEIDSTLTTEANDFLSPNDLVTFFDSHDLPRLLSVYNNQNRVNEALALLLACRGIPVVLYGDEQYLHNDTNNGSVNGGDPYNRIWMSSFNTQSTAYSLINLMANLRQTNPALAYGTSMQRWINSDVYILERQFNSDVVLIAVNKSETASYSIGGLFTSLPAGNFPDYLNGLMGGFSITVTNGNPNNNPVANFNLPTHTVAVWQFTTAATAPQVGSIGPLLGQSGITATIAGQGFGSSTGTVKFVSTSGATATTTNTWSDSAVTFTVPSAAPGAYQVQLVTSSGTNANTVPFTVLTGPLIPVTFTVNNVPALAAGSAVYLTGNIVELGSGVVTTDAAVGPLLQPPNANPPTSWFIDASVPAGTQIQFQFAIIASDGTVTMEPGAAHSYTVPTSGVGSISVNW